MADPKSPNAELLALLDVLQKRGAARVKLDAEGNLSEVEFTPGGAPVDDDGPTVADQPTAHEVALRQITSRSFYNPNGAGDGHDA